MKLLDLLYVIHGESTICIADNKKKYPAKVWGSKRKVKNITIKDIQKLGNSEVMSVSPGKDGCLYIHIWDPLKTKCHMACHEAIQDNVRYKKGGNLYL